MRAHEKVVTLNPVGFAPRITRKPLAPRLDTLEGKTIYLVDCRFDDSDAFLKQMQAWFAERMVRLLSVAPVSLRTLMPCSVRIVA